MKNYTITVNGNVYDVTVEENGASAPVAAPRKAAAPAAKAAAPFSALPDAAAKSSQALPDRLFREPPCATLLFSVRRMQAAECALL